MNTFPTISQGPKIEGFTDEYSDDAVSIPAPNNGHQVITEVHQFNPRNFSFMLRDVKEADKLTVETFYKNNKGKHFYWLNEQEDTTYEVVFMDKPLTQLDGANNRWRILVNLKQAGV